MFEATKCSGKLLNEITGDIHCGGRLLCWMLKEFWRLLDKTVSWTGFASLKVYKTFVLRIRLIFHQTMIKHHVLIRQTGGRGSESLSRVHRVKIRLANDESWKFLKIQSFLKFFSLFIAKLLQIIQFKAVQN